MIYRYELKHLLTLFPFSFTNQVLVELLDEAVHRFIRDFFVWIIFW